MWTDTTRKQFARSGLRLPSDLTDAEWAVLEPLFPPRSGRGWPPVWSYRQIVEALLYLLRGGLPVADAAAGLVPAADDGAALLLPLARHGAVCLATSRAAWAESSSAQA